MLYTWKLLGKAWEVWDGNDAQGIVSMIAFGIFVILIAKPGLTLPVKIFGCFATFAAFPFLWTGTLALINGFFYWLEHAKIVFEILVGVALTIGLMWAIGGHLDLSLPKGGGGGGGGHGGGHHH